MIHRQRNCFEKRTLKGLQQNETLSHPQATSHAFFKNDGGLDLAEQDNFKDFKTESYSRLKIVEVA